MEESWHGMPLHSNNANVTVRWVTRVLIVRLYHPANQDRMVSTVRMVE